MKKEIRPMSKETFEKLKEFDKVASFALWANPNGTVSYDDDASVDTNNVGDMTVLSDEKILGKAIEGIVTVALNASEHDDRKDGYTGPWAMFHSDYEYQKDFKIRHAIVNTPYEGCYMTDLIKNYPKKNSDELKEHLAAHPEVVAENIETLKRELSYFSEKPILVAFGRYTEEKLRKYLGDEYIVVYVPHYAHYINSQKLRQEFLKALEPFFS